MALIKCKECGMMYSTDLKACPSCGKRRTTWTTIAIAGIVGFIIFWAILASQQREQADTAHRAEYMAAMTPQQRKDYLELEQLERTRKARVEAALRVCQTALNRSLNDPDSAKLESTYRWFTEVRADGTILVQPSGRAKNAFGAYIHGTWDCVVQPEGGGVRVVSLNQTRP